MNMGLYIAQQVINAVSLGSLYALVAIGLSMVFGILRMTNFAHGDMMMVGAFAALVLGAAGLPFWLAALGGIVIAAIAGIVVERVAYRPVRGSPDVTLLLTSLGVTYILENLGILIFTSSPRNFPIPDLMNSSIQFMDGQITFTAINVVTVVLTAVSLAALGWFVTRTDAGLGTRATAEDLGAAQAGRARRQPADRHRLRDRLGLCRTGRRFVGRAGRHRRTRHGFHAVAQSLRGCHHRRLRLDCGRARRRLRARRIGSADRRLPALGSLALSRCDRLRLPDRLPSLPPERIAQPHAGGEAVIRPAALLSLLALLVLVAAVTAAAPRLVNDYAVRVLIVMCINAVLVASMGVGNGFTGVFSLGHVGFVAVGAYASGILSLPLAAKHAYLSDLPHWLGSFSLPFLPATIVAGLVCTALAFVVGAPLMRLSGYFVSVATLGFLIIVNVILINAVDYTRGARTFTSVPLETTLPWAVGWLAVTLLVLSRIVYSPYGRRYRAVREDTIAAQAIGISVLPTRLSAFMVGAFFAGVGGSLYGHYLGSFSPASFYMAYTFSLISMLVIGGMQSLTGAVVGVIVVTLASEVLRNLERGIDFGAFSVPPLYGASQIVLGIIFILVMIFRPSGIMGDRELTPGLLYSRKRRPPEEYLQ